MLAGTAMAGPALRALMAAATSSQGPALREEMVTLAPWAAICSAIALPLPREGPVITATFPVRSNSLPVRLPDSCELAFSITSLMGRVPLKRLFDFWHLRWRPPQGQA